MNDGIKPEETAAKDKRPVFPKRAVITGGMPYGNKALHFGHVGGVFVHADLFARFLRDRIGKENVIFVSGTDCYGSAIETNYQELKKNGYTGTIEDFIGQNHNGQKEVLDKYLISLDLYAASALGEASVVHHQLSADIFNTLYDGGYLKLDEVMQFYDEETGMYLNGRQVKGYCPIAGCRSETAYADECSLGHQYNPSELIKPVSVTSGKPPALKAVKNWYFDLERFSGFLKQRQHELDSQENCRKLLISVIDEFLKEPVIYVKTEEEDLLKEVCSKLPPHKIEPDKQKSSYVLTFGNLDDRAAACQIISENQLRYRTGKTLVPFRLSGNISWGIPVPEKENIKDLTFWVWPESLWAPISFTKAYLKQATGTDENWEAWWKDKDAGVYQFIGEDNIYFYAIAEMGLFKALSEAEGSTETPNLPVIVPNRHVFYGSKKASSSGKVKPPMAADLLEHYTAEQLRMHFAHMSLAKTSASFNPKAVMENKEGFDATLAEGNILTNVYNRLVRSCFYSMQKYFDGKLPEGTISETAIQAAEDVIKQYEWSMYRFEFYRVIELLDGYLRESNKTWVADTKTAEQTGDETLRAQVLLDSFHVVRVAATLLHPLAPEGTERVRDYLGFSQDMWSWDTIFEPFTTFIKPGHQFKFLEPRTDFFFKHDSQLKK